MLRAEVDRVIVELVVARHALVERHALSACADVDFDNPLGRTEIVAFFGTDVGHAGPPPLRGRPLLFGLGFGPASGLSTSFSAFAFLGLRASLLAALLAGSPAPLSAGVS